MVREGTSIPIDAMPTGSQADNGRDALGRLLAQQAAVTEMAQRALGERDLGSLLDQACVLAARVLEAELVSVLELAPDQASLLVAAGVGWRPGVIGQLVVPVDSGSQSGYTLATGGPVIAEDLATESRFAVSDTLVEHGARAGISVRIGGPDDPYGVLAAFTTQPRRFAHDDAGFLQSLANVLGSAVGRLRAEGELRRSRDQLATIVGNVTDGITVQAPDGRLVFANDAGARLSGFETADEFVAAPMERVMEAFELLDEHGDPLPFEALPGRIALATGQPAPPTLLRFRVRATGDERFSEVQAIPITDPAGRVTQVINIFRDVTAQQRATLAHEILADVMAVLSGTLDVDEAARLLAELCVPRVADYCVVDLLEPDGTVRMAAIAHVDPERIGIARRLSELRTRSLDDATGSGRVIREGKAEMAEISDEMIRASATNEEELSLLLQLGLHSYVCVPLSARGRPVGALSLVVAESGRRFDERDLQLAEEIGSRAGVALENARLYEAADERRAELEAVITAMGEAVLLFNEKGRLRLSNRAATSLFGDPPPATIAELREQLEPADGVELSDRDIPEGEHRLAGSGRWLEVNVYRPAVGGQRRGARWPAVVVVRDVTEARTAQLARDAFIGVLSHELRTPITTIYGGSELLGRGLQESDERQMVADIRAESERLARLVEDLLVMSRVERGGVEIGDEPVLIQRLVPPLVAAMTSRWPGLEVDMRFGEALPAVRGDPTYLEQVMRNLLTNAVRYGDGLAKGVEVDAWPAGEGDGDAGDGEIVVRVLDRGPGPGTAAPERLFDLFYRAPAARLIPGGAGIGLFVCRQLVEAMGGRIWARAREGGGTEFGFALPTIEADVSG